MRSSDQRHREPARRVPPNFFGFRFGLAGLFETWRIPEQYGRAPEGVGDGLAALSALAWLSVLLAYLRFAVCDRSGFRRDLEDPVLAPFLSLALTTPMLLAVLGLVPHVAGPGRLLFDVFVVFTVLLGSWLTASGCAERCSTITSSPPITCPRPPAAWLAPTALRSPGSPASPR
jgi:tellurite resistance protein TehA-like permease